MIGCTNAVSGGGVADKSILPSKLAYPDNVSVYYNNQPTITANGTGVDIKIVGTIYLCNNNGGAYIKQLSIASATTYTVPHNQYFIWNLDTNTLETTTLSTQKTYNSVLLAFVNNGLIRAGALKQTTIKDLTLTTQPLIFYSGKARYTSLGRENGTSAGVQLSLTGGTLFLINEVGTTVKSLPITQTYTLANNQILCWDIAANTLSVMTYGAGRSENSIVLALVHNGAIKGGYFKDSYCIGSDEPLVKEFFGNTIPSASSQNTRIVGAAGSAGQGLTVVGDEIWVFNYSDDNHSTSNGTIKRYNKQTFEQIGATITHNLGHCNAVDYCANNDCLITTTLITNPEVMIFKNVSAWKNLNTVDYNTADKIVLQFNNPSRGNLIATTMANACWGEINHGSGDLNVNDIIYLSTSNQMIIYKILLGTGTNDLSVVDSPDTLTHWGTYISGKGDNEFNGTALILKKYTSTIDHGNNQGITYWNKGILAGVGFTYARAVHLKLYEDGKILCDDDFTAQYINKDGSTATCEPQGLAILDGMYLIQGGRGGKFILTPLYNKQGGTGTIGTAVTLPFSCNSTPRVQITPLSPTTDLYISTISNAGFTVSSASGGLGTYNWECQIC